MKIVMFSGSLRAASLNKKLLAAAQRLLAEKADHQIKVVDLKSLAIPVYDGDIETVGIPDGVVQLGSAIQNADALVIASPEYNASIAGSLKNAIDWVSRLRPVPFEKKPILLMGASPGYFGAIRALGATRAPFETLGAYVFPQTFALPKAAEAFIADGSLADEASKKKLASLLVAFASFAKRFANE